VAEDYPGWQAKLSKYMFYIDVPSSQGVDTGGERYNFELSCTVTDWKTGAEHKISVTYSSSFSGLLQGTVDGSDSDYEINITTNSSVLMQDIQWALALPNTKVFFVAGSSANGHYPYAVTSFTLSPLTEEPGLVAAGVALPKITADTPDDLRRARELRRERQARHHSLSPNL
jgi:hypothetical protein